MRLIGFGLGRVGMKKLKNSHKGMCCAKISHKGMCCTKFAQGRVLCENFAPDNVLCEIRTGHYSPVQMRNWILSNGHNFFVSNPN